MADKRTNGKQSSGMSFANLLRVIISELSDKFVMIDSKTDKAIEKRPQKEKNYFQGTGMSRAIIIPNLSENDKTIKNRPPYEYGIKLQGKRKNK